MDLLHRMAGMLYPRRHWLATAGVGLFAALIFYHVLFGTNGMIAYRHKMKEYKQVQQELQQAQAENERLQQRIKALKSDPEAIEKEAREQLKYAKPGEVIYVLPAPKPTVPATATAEKH